MPTPSPADAGYQRDLGDGLRLRWSTAADAERLIDLYSHVFRDRADAPVDARLIAWVRDMLSGQHPLVGPGDFALVEEAAGSGEGRVVAATCLMAQRWTYAGIPFPVGRPEVVASHPDYRRRGLVRRVFELIHARGAARGDLALGITGIYYFYRQLGYEYALDLGGGRSMPFAALPALKEGEAEPYALRDATPDDVPRLLALHDRDRAPALVSTPIDGDYWRYAMTTMNPASGEGWRTHMIVATGGEPVGMVLTRRVRRRDGLAVAGLAVEPGVPLVRALPSVLRALRGQADSLLSDAPTTTPVQSFRFTFGRLDHPVYAALGEARAPRLAPPYAWYVRVPDLPAFIRHIAPALERRLAGSVAAGWSGELRLDFYRGGLRLAFAEGRLTAAADWQAEVWGEEAQAGFPPLVFLQLLFGHRGLADLRASFPDAWADDDTTPLLDALFPRQASWALPLD